MSVATMTSKGQITVPKDVRDALGLQPGTKVSFTRNSDGDYVLSTTTHRIGDLGGMLAYSGPPKSLEDMEAGIVAGAAGK